MRFLKHLGRLLKEFFGFAWHNKAWWIVPDRAGPAAAGRC